VSRNPVVDSGFGEKDIMKGIVRGAGFGEIVCRYRFRR